jgi:hypothetical protein
LPPYTLSRDTTRFHGRETIICQRWGSFSVRDHLPEQAFVLETLLYDRLIIPVPPEKKDDPKQEERKRWIDNRWNPDRLESLLKILGTELVSPIPWSQNLQESFKTRSAAASQLTLEVANDWTRSILAGIDPASRPVPAEAKNDIQLGEIEGEQLGEIEGEQQQGQREERDLAFTICRRFLKPKGVFSPCGVRLGTELLQQAVDLAGDSEFKKNRWQFYEWEEKIIHQGYSTKESIQ